MLTVNYHLMWLILEIKLVLIGTRRDCELLSHATTTHTDTYSFLTVTLTAFVTMGLWLAFLWDMVVGCRWQRRNISRICGGGREKQDQGFLIKVNQSFKLQVITALISCLQVCVRACRVFIFLQDWLSTCLRPCVCFNVCVLSRWWLTVCCPVGRQKVKRGRCFVILPCCHSHGAFGCCHHQCNYNASVLTLTLLTACVSLTSTNKTSVSLLLSAREGHPESFDVISFEAFWVQHKETSGWNPAPD